MSCFMDWHIGPTMRNNVKRIVDRGLVSTQWEVLLNMYLTILTSESIAVGLAILSGCFEAQPRFDIKLLYNILQSLVFNEFVFTMTHRYFLHGTAFGARIHEIHHTCRPSSFSTSFIFHFLDSNTEFTCSFVCMSIFSNLVLKDPLSLLYSMQFAYMWYTVGGHSENLKWGHFYHHRWISSNYSAYSNFFRLKGRDFVRERVYAPSGQASSPTVDKTA